MVHSWRGGASQQVQDDLDGLLDAALPFATQMLDEHGEFFPYGVALDAAGNERMIAGDPGSGERPESSEVLATLVQGLQQQRRDLRAVALVSDVLVAGSDAIRVELEHREGQLLAVLLRYKKKRFRSGIEYGELSASPGTAHVWMQT